MRLAALVLCALPLAGCAAGSTLPAPAASASQPDPRAAMRTSELPRSARPVHYTIDIVPDAAALRFTGREAIDLELLEASPTITLQAHNLEIENVRATPASGGAAIPMAVSYDRAREQATFAAPRALPAGAYRVELDYRGQINRQPSGFFALDYPDKRTGQPARALYTQFEVPDAREFAPLFDEPAYKATFTLSATVPKAQMAVSNMPVAREDAIDAATKRVTFATSPKMSSYLLFFALGDFERTARPTTAGTEVGIIAPTGSGDTARYALDAAAALVPYYNDYFGIRFPLPKLDNVAAPGQSQQFGAMENWGAIFTFESSLLLDPRNTSPARQHYLYTALAHETAHQWFGDLVTPEWWDDLWLNEGFASWMETKASDHFNPGWSELVGRVNTRERAMDLDSLSSSHPIVVKLATAGAADSAFDSISYAKGESVITMLEAYAGEDTWRDGVRRFLAAHAYGNAVTEDLWRAQEQAGTPEIARIADSFTRQPGVPLVISRQRCEGGRTMLSLQQSEFSRDRKDAAAQSPRHWLVSLSARAADGSMHRQLLDRSAQMALPGCGPVIVNGGQNGYFRTLYEAPALAALTAAMPSLPPVEQLGLTRDALALSAAGYQDYAPSLDMLAAVPGNANPIVAKAAIEAWARLYGLLESPADRARLAAIAHDRWFGRLQQLGFDPKPNEPFLDTDLRAELLSSFGNMADPTVSAEARRRFARLSADRAALDGPLKSTWIEIVASNATPADWDTLRQLGKTAPTAVEKTLFYTMLGRASDPALARRALELALTDEPGATTRAPIVVGVAARHADLAFDFATSHQSQIDSMVDDYSRSSFLPRLLATTTNPAMLDRLEAIRLARPEGARKPVVEQIASLRERLASRPRVRAQVAAWLAHS